MTDVERYEFRNWLWTTRVENLRLIERWKAEPAPVRKARKPLTDEQRAARRERRRLNESLTRAGDAPSRGHMRKRGRR